MKLQASERKPTGGNYVLNYGDSELLFLSLYSLCHSEEGWNPSWEGGLSRGSLRYLMPFTSITGDCSFHGPC